MDEERYTPQHLKKWSPVAGCDSWSNYMGEDYSDFYVAPCAIAPNVADCLSESNWEIQLSDLETACEHDESGVAHFGHWASDYKLFLIHQDDEPGLRCADELAKALEDYPVLDDSDLSERELEEAERCWKDWGESDLIKEIENALPFELPAKLDVFVSDSDLADIAMECWNGSGDDCAFYTVDEGKKIGEDIVKMILDTRIIFDDTKNSLIRELLEIPVAHYDTLAIEDWLKTRLDISLVPPGLTVACLEALEKYQLTKTPSMFDKP